MQADASMPPGAVKRTLSCGELRFTAWELGQGPLVVLVHGFPDTPHTFAAQLPALAAAGYRAVAVTLRGYEPSSQPASGSYHVRNLAQDVIDWIAALGESRAHLVAHDWGATIAFAAAALSPLSVRSLTAIAVPQPLRFAESLGSHPEQLPLLGYIMEFQPVGTAEAQVRADDWAYLERLCNVWSPAWAGLPAWLAAVKRQLSLPGVLGAALTYYRQALDATSPLSKQGQALFAQPVPCPTLGLCGERDGCILADVFEQAMRPADFPAGLRVERVTDAGHFVHLEQPAAVHAHLLGFLHAVDSLDVRRSEPSRPCGQG